METAKVAKSMSGDSLYQERARRALPLLVRQAEAGTPIRYSDLAAELGMPNPRNLNYVLGSIGKALEALSKDWGTEVPMIQALVINKDTGLPGTGIAEFFASLGDYRKLPKLQRQRIVRMAQQEVFAFPIWHAVLTALGLEPLRQDFSLDLSKATLFRGVGESEGHRRLKEYVARTPSVVGLSGASKGECEFGLPSGDSVDVAFETREEWIAVEVKSDRSPREDIVRGLFQCVKYRAVGEALQSTLRIPKRVRAMLVLGGALPPDLVRLKNLLGVEVRGRVVPPSAP